MDIVYRPCSFPECQCCPENCNPGIGWCCYDCRENPRNAQSKREEDAAAELETLVDKLID